MAAIKKIPNATEVQNSLNCSANDNNINCVANS